jgi:hypothetical protein
MTPTLKCWGYRLLFGIFLLTGLADAAVAGTTDGKAAVFALSASVVQFGFARLVARLAWKNMVLI